MKKQILTIAIAVFAVLHINAQNGVSVNATGAAADPSAMLDVSSSNKGVLIPRITEAERLLISNPARGLMVYQIDNADGFWYYDGSAWGQFGDNLGNHIATDTLNMSNKKITNLATCTQNLDAANKEYVDNAVSAGGGGATKPSMISNESATAYTYADAMQYCESLNEGGYTDWSLPTYEEIRYFSGMSTATANYLWTTTRSAVDFQANQNFISVKLDDGKWRNGDEQLAPVILSFTSTNEINPNISLTHNNAILPYTSGNWLKVTDINFEVRRGSGRIKFNFPNNTSFYSPTYSTTSSTFTNFYSWSNIQNPILISSIDLESTSGSNATASYPHNVKISIVGIEVAPLQKEGATLYARCVR